MVRKKIDWKHVEESNLLIHKTGNTVRVKFLNEGEIEETIITDKDSGEEKTIDKYVFQVVDLADNREKEYSALSTRFAIALKEYTPLKEKSFSIRKYQFGTDKFDIDYEINPL